MVSFSQNEIVVAKILRKLPKLITRSLKHRRRRLKFCRAYWGKKKRRSAYSTLSASAPLPSVPEKTSVVVQIPKVAAFSPATPLLVYPSTEEEVDKKTTVVSSSYVSTNFRPSRKAKVHNKEWIKKRKDLVSALIELNRSLRKEVEEKRNQFKSLSAENTRLKEIKSKCEMNQKRMTQKEERPQQEEQQQREEEKENITPAGPTVAQVQQESKLLTTSQTKPEVPIAPPQHNQNQIHFSVSRSPTSSSRNIGRHGGLEIPDLNAHVDENGFVAKGPNSQSFQQHLIEVFGNLNPKKAAYAKARRDRMESNRRKAAAGGGAALSGGNRVGLLV